MLTRQKRKFGERAWVQGGAGRGACGLLPGHLGDCQQLAVLVRLSPPSSQKTVVLHLGLIVPLIFFVDLSCTFKFLSICYLVLHIFELCK